MEYATKDNLFIQEDFSKNYNNFLAGLIVNTINKHGCKTVLDYGCADGFFIKKVSEKLDNNINIVGVDTDSDFRQICNENNIKVYEYLNQCNENFDLVYMLNVLEHIEDDKNALNEIYERLNPNGVILIYVPAFMFVYSSLDKEAGHYRRYKLKELKEKIEQSGFNIEKIEYCDSIGILASIMYKLKDILLNNNKGQIKKWQVEIYDFVYPLSRFFDKLLFSRFWGKNIYTIAIKRQKD